MILQIPCHRRSDRSFLKLQKYIPLCARCTGMLIGILMFPIYFYITLSFLLQLYYHFLLKFRYLLMDLPKSGNGSSTNLLRLTTGVLSGNGMGLFISSSVIWILS